MDWFERITGFVEQSADSTRERLYLHEGWLVSRVDGRSAGVGRFHCPTLEELRSRAAAVPARGRTTVRCLAGDVRKLHADPAHAEAVFQVASQFNALEMTSPHVTPEDGVTRYAWDRTQGPACAMAAGAATIWRNDFLQIDGQVGQTATRQLDNLAGVGRVLAQELGLQVSALWAMRNGYALCTPEGLRLIGEYLRSAGEAKVDRVRASLAVAVHEDVEVTDLPPGQRHRLIQIFCSALPVAYTRLPLPAWEPFARLVLEAAYEATLLAAVLNRERSGSSKVLLTRLGGGAFGNDGRWIDAAIERALRTVESVGLDVMLVDYGSVSPESEAISRRWAGR